MADLGIIHETQACGPALFSIIMPTFAGNIHEPLLMNQKILTALLLTTSLATAQAQTFDTYFVDKTLRVDYIFSGNRSCPSISLWGMTQLPTWAGRRHHLDETPLKGWGDLCMRDHASGEVIYRTSFSSLFQEWLQTDEAVQTDRSFENTFLLPYPKAEADVSLTLYDDRGQAAAHFTHAIRPDDILIRRPRHADTPEHVDLLRSGSPAECIDVVILAEGYTAEERELFYADARRACQSLLAHEPFGRLRHKFNIVAVACESKESGVSIPRADVWKETAFGSHFDTFYSERYLTTSHVRAIHDQLVNIPYEHIIILANTDTYGGGGIYNAYTLTTAHHDKFDPVVVHEFGHSFGGLGDEYFYENDLFADSHPHDVEPWEPNVTTLIDFGSKWEDMLPAGTPVPTVPDPAEPYRTGVYEGAHYTAKGAYRPAYDCRMRSNAATQFCPVCQRALARIIHFYTERP